MEEVMGVELELGALFLMAVVGMSVFGRFEVETPAPRQILRWLLAAAVTLGSYAWIGHWALAVLAGFGCLGATVHLVWCWRHGIHPATAEPRRKYYALRGWAWPDS